MNETVASEPAGREDPLLRRFLTGDAAACRTVERWAREILTFRGYGVPADDWDDVVQETVAGLWRAASRPGFELRASLRTLVQRIATARCIDRLRRRRPTEELSDQLADPGADPYLDLLERDRAARVQWAVRRLDPPCQEIIRQRFYEDVSYAEIAAREQRSEATLRVRLFNCMKAVRKLLGGARLPAGLGLVLLATVALRAAPAAAAPASLDSLRHALERGHYAEAARAANERLEAEERSPGVDSADVAQTLDAYSYAESFLGKIDHARWLAERAVRIKEKRFGLDHPQLAKSLNALARAFWDAGNLDSAAVLERRAIAIVERQPAAQQGDLPGLLGGLAGIFSDGGDEASARPLYERVLALREKTLGPDDPQVAFALNALGITLKRLGDYAAAKQVYEQALAIREKVLPGDHPDLAWSLNNYANLLDDLGEWEKARQLHERALAIREKILGPDHPDVAFSLNNLGNVLQELGENERALPLEERALAIREKVFGPNHSLVGLSLSGLALTLSNLGQYARAESLFRRSLAIREKALGPDHPDVARTLQRLGRVLENRGDELAARPCFTRSLAIRLKAFGPDHPETAEALANLAQSLARSGLTDSAFALALRSEEIARHHLRLMARGMDERTALTFANNRPGGIELVLSIAAHSKDARPALDSLAWDALVRSRAMVEDEMAGRARALVESNDPELERLADSVSSARAELARLVVKGPNPSLETPFLEQIHAAERRAEVTELALAERSLRFRAQLRADECGLAAVLAAIPAEHALVAYAQYEPLDLPGPTSVVRPSEIVAFVAHAGSPRIQVLALGRADSIATRVTRWLEQAEAPPSAASRARREAECRSAGVTLRAAVWDPLAGALSGSKRVLVVPDAELDLINFAALPDGQSGFVIERGPEIHLLSAERDVAAGSMRRPAGQGLLAFGGPAFDRAPALEFERGRHAQGPAGDSTATRGAMRVDCGDFQSLRFEALPAAALEVKAIGKMWNAVAAREGLGGVVERTGDQASERAFKSLAPTRRVLHLATHGFFLTGACDRPLPGANGARAAARVREASSVARDNPLLRSGLALAGANLRARAMVADEDGLLTAQEIAALDLSGVEWAVLSACETGRGELRAGEGVLGLRRAFQVAGAGTVLMSLWSVDDQSTRRWMERLYAARLERRLETADAVRAACLETLRERRARGLSDHPFYWAAFVASGDWR